MTDKSDNSEVSDAAKEAAALGVEAGMLMAGAVVHLDLLARLGPVFGMMSGSPHRSIFSKCLIETLTTASRSGVDGVRERSNMAYQLRQVHGEMCKRATDYAIEHRGKGNDKIVTRLNHMLEVAKSCGRAADALYAPVEQNLEALIEDGRRIAAIQKMQQRQEAESKLEALVTHDCGNSNCPVHTKN